MAQESWNCDTAEGSGCQQQEGLVLCPNNCGFFGCAATMNLCSKCYRELTLKKQGSPSEMAMASSVASPVHLSPVGSEKSCSKSPFSLSLPASDPVKSQIVLPSSKMGEISPESLEPSCSSSPVAHASSDRSLVADLAPIAALLMPDLSQSKDPQPMTSRRQSSNRCLTCKKRMGLLGFKCRCGNVFCALHRYSDKHGCPFDYKLAGREAIAKANPIVKAQKVERI